MCSQCKREYAAHLETFLPRVEALVKKQLAEKATKNKKEKK